MFSGCGGFDIGAKEAGAQIIYANELVPDFCATLKKYFTETEIIEKNIHDIKTFPSADLVVGGYPCQPFSLGGNRDPEKDTRTYLFKEFARCLESVQPKFFIAENVSGLQNLKKGFFLEQQTGLFSNIGKYGYRITAQILNAKDFGIPQSRKRLFIVGVRKDLEQVFIFPEPTHGKQSKKNLILKPYESHGEAIKDLPLWPNGEFYERPHDSSGNFSWYYMSRNRKAKWGNPSYTIVANWRHITLHPASPVMKLTWSNLSDGWKQRWDFSDEYEHTENNPSRLTLDKPRRLSWRECARIQTFPPDFEPVGNIESKFTQIGNAVPPLLAKILIKHLIDEKGLIAFDKLEEKRQTQLLLL